MPSFVILRRRMPELDVLRGIAILLVLFLHGMHDQLLLLPSRPRTGLVELTADVTRFGWTGVNLFFVLSGFLITGILLDTRRDQEYFSRFYLRRARRILPALYVMLAALQLGGWMSWRSTAAGAVFLANCSALLGVGIGYPPLWSLAVEEHFYLLWPQLVRRLSMARLAALMLWVCMLTPAAILLWCHPGAAEEYTWFNLDGLSMGALLAIWLRSDCFDRRELRAFAIAALPVGGSLFAILASGSSPRLALLEHSASNLAASGALAGCLVLGTGPWEFLVDRPFLRWCGYISYGLYLVHLIAFKAVHILLSPLERDLHFMGVFAFTIIRFVLGCALAMLFAYLSRRSLEEFFLRPRPRRSPAAVPREVEHGPAA